MCIRDSHQSQITSERPKPHSRQTQLDHHYYDNLRHAGGVGSAVLLVVLVVVVVVVVVGCGLWAKTLQKTATTNGL